MFLYPQDLKKKYGAEWAIVTGGSSGIGKSIGDFLFEKGFEVYGTSRFPEKYKNSHFPLLKLVGDGEKPFE